MAPYPNLVSDSVLVNDTIDLLRVEGGTAPAVDIVAKVMSISSPAPSLATMLVSDLAESDPRIEIVGDSVRLVEPDSSGIQLSESSFVVFDLETTGAKAPPCRVTEIGACRVEGGRVTDEFQTLVNPGIPIPEFITGLTGISDDMVSGAPAFREVAEEFLHFIGSSILVAHNAMFDIRFLNHEIGLMLTNYRIANPYLCTVRLSRKLVPEIENHKLNTVANFFSVDLTNHHRAAADARATALIFLRLLERLGERGVDDLGAALKCRF